MRSPERELELPDTDEVTERELSMAQLLIESMESDWDPERYHDTHREKVEALIEEKRQGHEIVIQAPEEAPAKVVDLMEALNARPTSRRKRRSRAQTGENGKQGHRPPSGRGPGAPPHPPRRGAPKRRPAPRPAARRKAS